MAYHDKLEGGHSCKRSPDDEDYDVYGHAVTKCHEDKDHRLWISNDAYASQASFCPFCGYEAKNRTKVVHEEA